MTTPGTQSRRATAFLLLAILVLGFVVVAQQRRETRLKAALARFESRAQQRIYDRLDHPSPLGASPKLPLNWGASAPLEDVIARIRALTQLPRFASLQSGLPIQFDPTGMEEAGQSLTSRVQVPPSPNKDISLRELLHLILGPLNLAYEIKDGALLITSRKELERSHQRILTHLEQPVLLTWHDGATLEEVIERFRLSTRWPDSPLGLPIYADFNSIDSADLENTIVESAPREQLSIREHLDRVLEPLGMGYELRDGALMIISRKKAGESSRDGSTLLE